jgi:lysophospholipase L1-like esterase
VGLELLLRGVGVKPHGGVLLSDDDCYYGWEPNARETLTKAGLRRDLITDANGFRVAAHRQALPQPSCEVLALGDSWTEGMFVTADEAWPAVLESLLRARGYHLRVDNGGMSGHSILQERIAALGRWRALRPTIVIVQHTANDLMDLATAEAHGCNPSSPVPSTFHPANQSMLRELRLFRIAQEFDVRLEVLSGVAGAMGHPMGSVEPQECERLSADYAAAALALADGVGSSGGHFLLALWEGFFCASPNPPDMSAVAASLHQRLDDAGAAFLDASEVLAIQGSNLLPIDAHPSALGHRLFAERVAAALEGNGWLAPCRESRR